MPGSARTVIGATSSARRRSVTRSESRDDLADQRAHVDQRRSSARPRPRFSRSRSRKSPTIRSSRPAFCAIRRARSRDSSRDNVEVLALERDGEPEDRGERGAQVVRHGVEERCLHFVFGAQALGLQSFEVERALQLLRPALIGHVEQQRPASRRGCPRRRRSAAPDRGSRPPVRPSRSPGRWRRTGRAPRRLEPRRDPRDARSCATDRGSRTTPSGSYPRIASVCGLM